MKEEESALEDQPEVMPTMKSGGDPGTEASAARRANATVQQPATKRRPLAEAGLDPAMANLAMLVAGVTNPAALSNASGAFNTPAPSPLTFGRGSSTNRGRPTSSRGCGRGGR